MSKTRVRYEHVAGVRVAAHRLTLRERITAAFWAWAQRYCS